MYTDPFEYMRKMQEEIDESFDRFFGRVYPKTLPYRGDKTALSRVREPLSDLIEEKDHYKLIMEMPGINKEDIDIDITEDTITVKGESKSEKKEEDKEYYHRERTYTSFQRTMRLPGKVNPDESSAEYKNGVLEIKLKKKYADKQTKIKVK